MTVFYIVISAYCGWFLYEILFLYADRGNDNWLIKYDVPDIVENHEDVSRLTVNLWYFYTYSIECPDWWCSRSCWNYYYRIIYRTQEVTVVLPYKASENLVINY